MGLSAIGRSARFKANAAYGRGGVLLLLGLGVLVEVGRRAIFGSEPASGWMIGVALLSLVVNMTVLRMLSPLRSGGVHLRASWIFTRADVVANVGVVLSGVLRSEEHTSELQSLMRISYAVFCLIKKTKL